MDFMSLVLITPNVVLVGCRLLESTNKKERIMLYKMVTSSCSSSM
jgi:hypothetical protein